MKNLSSLSRRDFLKLAGLGVGSMAFGNLRLPQPLPDFPIDKPLGRLDRFFGKQDIKSQPDQNSPSVKTIFEDTVVEWLREVVGSTYGGVSYSRSWVETPEGFLYLPFIQQVWNRPNQPVSALPEGKAGFWAEVSVPYVDLFLENPPAHSQWAQNIIAAGANPRLYYSQVVWIDQIKTGDSGQLMYRFNEDGGRPKGITGGSYGELFWAEGAAFRPLTPEDVAPIHPEVDPASKLVVVDTTRNYQWLSCLEGLTEVYFCRCSTGAQFDSVGGTTNAAANWSTPLGEHWTWRRTFSIHMSAGTTGAGYDTPAISWTSLFSGDGVAIHAAFWHNDFGTPRSHGCVNVAPEDAKWIFRWMQPQVSLDQGDVQISGPDGTHVRVVQKSI